MTLRSKKKANFWQRIRLKYRLSFLNENTLEEVFSFRLSQLSALLVTFGLMILFICIVIFTIVNTPLRNYLPGYLDVELKSQLVSSGMRLDSLTEQNERRELYIQNIRNILKGEIRYEEVVPLDSIVRFPTDSLLEKSDREKLFVAKFEEEEKYNLTILPSSLPSEGMLLYPPLRGVVTDRFDPDSGKFGIDIECARNALVAAPSDGVVIFSAYTLDAEHVLQIQHSNGLVSIYKYIGQPMKEIGEEIAGGSVIGMVANRTAESDKPHLYYELWHKSSPLNPEDYINF